MSNFANSNVTQGSHGPAYVASMESVELFRTGFYQKAFKQFGRMYGMHDMLNGMGMELSVPSQNQKVVEKYASKWPVKIKTAISTGTAGDPIEIVIDSTSLVGNLHQARVGFTVKIPADYMPTAYRKDGIYKITALSTTTIANDTLTCEPALAGTSYTKSQIATEVPAGTYLDVNGYSMFSRGEGQPAGTKDFPITREYTSHIIKETKGFDGAVMAHEGEIAEYNGTNWLISSESLDAEFRMKDQIDDALTFAEPNDNDALVTSSTMSTEEAANRSTRGLVSWLDDAGQKIYYTDSPTLTVFDDIKSAMISQGVYGDTVTVFCSLQFHDDMLKQANDYIREYSGGSDFLDSAKERLGICVKTIYYGGINYFLHPVATWSNPSDAGLKVDGDHVYAAGTMAVAVPNAKVSVNDYGQEGKVTIPNLMIGYVSKNGESRKRLFGRYLGVNGVMNTDLVASDLDGYKLYWGSEFMLMGAEWNKMVLIRKQKV